MAQIKHAQIRYRVIDKALNNPYSPFPNKENLRQACEEAIYGSTNGEEISDSTIEKDLFCMRMDMDAPIAYSKKEKGYYYTDEKFSIDQIPLSHHDIDALRFATKTLLQFKDVPIFSRFKFAMQKILDRVEVSGKSEGEQSTIQFDQGSNPEANNYLTDIHSAIQYKKVVEFDYQSFYRGIKKKRFFEPYLLKEYSNRWYTIGYDHEKSKIITYSLDRISNLSVTDEPHQNQENFDPQEFFKYSIGITVGEGSPEKIVLKVDNIAAKYLISQPLHFSQKVSKEGKNKTTLELKLWITEELIREIMSYGGAIEVKKPKSLKSEIKKRVAVMMNHYS